MVHAILSVLRTGGAGRCVPNAMPPWGMVAHAFWGGRNAGPWQRLNETLRDALRGLEGHHRHPSAAMIDSQSVTTPARGGDHGVDRATKGNGRKRPSLGDTLGWRSAVGVTAANGPARDGAKPLWPILPHGFPRRRGLWAAGASAGTLETWVGWRRRSRKVRLEMGNRSEAVPRLHRLAQKVEGGTAVRLGWQVETVEQEQLPGNLSRKGFVPIRG